MTTPAPPRSDPDLMAAVLEALQDEPDLTVTDLSVEYVEGTLVLRGSAGSAEERDRAGDLARIASGGAPIENRIRT